MPISKDEKMKVLRKLCENLQKLQPLELPALAYQLFSLCNTAALITIPILSLNRYFHRNYYARIMDTSSEQSNPDSIGTVHLKFIFFDFVTFRLCFRGV